MKTKTKTKPKPKTKTKTKTKPKQKCVHFVCVLFYIYYKIIQFFIIYYNSLYIIY
jgi:hypothetical protein